MSARNASSETMTLFSPELAARLDALVEKYPVRRSALVPMLLYAQDEIGYLSDAVIAEVAERIGITELEVRTWPLIIRCCVSNRRASSTFKCAQISVACCAGERNLRTISGRVRGGPQGWDGGRLVFA